MIVAKVLRNSVSFPALVGKESDQTDRCGKQGSLVLQPPKLYANVDLLQCLAQGRRSCWRWVCVAFVALVLAVLAPGMGKRKRAAAVAAVVERTAKSIIGFVCCSACGLFTRVGNVGRRHR